MREIVLWKIQKVEIAVVTTTMTDTTTTIYAIRPRRLSWSSSPTTWPIPQGPLLLWPSTTRWPPPGSTTHCTDHCHHDHQHNPNHHYCMILEDVWGGVIELRRRCEVVLLNYRRGVRWYYWTMEEEWGGPIVGWLGWNEVNWCMRLSGAEEWGEGLRSGGRGWGVWGGAVECGEGLRSVGRGWGVGVGVERVPLYSLTSPSHVEVNPILDN